MSEENEVIADSNDSVSEDSFDMESAQETISNDMFPSKDEEIDEDQEIEIVDEIEEVEEVEEKEEKAEKTEKVEEEKEEQPARQAPASWKKEMRELYNSANPELQSYIEERENQMKAGLEQDRNDSNLGRTFRDIVAPHTELFQQTGVQPAQAVQYLLNAHKALSSGTAEQKQSAIKQLEQSYGISAPDENSNPQITSLSQKIAQIEQMQHANAEEARQAKSVRIQAEVDAFAKDHPLLDDLENEIAGFINLGYDLEEAYKKAERSSEGYIQRETERLMKERDEKAEAQRQKELKEAKKAKSVNVRGRTPAKTPTGPIGTMEDTMRETLRTINSRN